ncbi:SUKH-4 family immunity protein [Asanoa sp. NPDC050611]|uniref:SUKH-4 family immunity protein n=1 Tax=Asanoa sp. NPDC050611 TaxID=3157098 RepID=UPI0033E1D5F1
MSGTERYAAGALEGWDARRWWGNRLVPVAESSVEGRPVGIYTSHFLTGVGFPAECPLEVTLNRDERLLVPLRFRDTDFLVIGDDYGTTLVVEAGNDAVWSINPQQDIFRFVNSNVGHFVDFLGLYQALCEYGRDLGEEQESALVDDFRAWLRHRDAAAFEDDDHWWSLIVEQVEDGFL